MRDEAVTKKEKIRYAAACVLAVFFILLSVILLDAAFAEVFMMPSQMTETFYGFVLFALAMTVIALFLIGIGMLSVGALAAFFAFSFWKHPKKSVRYPMRSVFISSLCFIALDAIALAVLLL